MTIPTHINDLVPRLLTVGGGAGSFFSGMFTFLSANYQAIGAIGVIVSIPIGVAGAIWNHKIKSLQAQKIRAEIDRAKMEML